ncbi:MAG: hypothetical protein SFX73_01745, partial [Kofleriaceae bacterium]|nr:hypothetical protein [Kofleriaceae bacterium]
MQDAAYLALLAKITTTGIDEAEFEQLFAAAVARDDAPSIVVLHLIAGRVEEAVAHAARVDADAARAIVRHIAALDPHSPGWDTLVGIVETRPELVGEIEAALAAWPVSARCLPAAWLAEIRKGKHHPRHRLVQSVMLDGSEVDVLRSPACARSLANVQHLAVNMAEGGGLAELQGAGLDAVTSLSITQSVVSPRAVGDLIVGASFPRLQRLSLSGLSSDRPYSGRREYPNLIPRDIDNPLELDAIAKGLDGRSTQRPRFSLGLNALGSDAEGLRALVRQPALAGIEQLAFAGIYLDEGAA